MSLFRWVGRALALCLPLTFLTLSPGAQPSAVGSGQAKPTLFLSSEGRAAIAHAKGLVDKGRIAEAATYLNRAAEQAHGDHESVDEARILQILSGCRIRLFDYQGAEQAAAYSREVALKIRDFPVAGSASVNLATIYSQLGDYARAAHEATYGAQLLASEPNKTRLAKALLIYADVEAERARGRIEADRARGDAPAERTEIAGIEQNYRHGVDVAHEARLPHLEANIWEELGYSLLLVQRPQLAEEPLQKAFQLETKSHDEDALAVNRAHQAELQLQQHNYRAALALIDQAFAGHSEAFRMTPLFYPLHIRGVLLEALNRKSEALVELKKAVDSATEWRQGALPGDATSTRTVVVLHDVYEDYAQLAAELSLERDDPSLAREGLEVLAENRAANLRDEIKLALSQKQRLPQRYYDLLSELREAQAKVTLGKTGRKIKRNSIRCGLKSEGWRTNSV